MEQVQMKHKFVVNEATLINHNKSGEGFQIKPEYFKKVTQKSKNEFEVSLKVEIHDTPENPFPFELTVAISLITSFDDVDKISQSDLDDYLNRQCLQILFPYLRSSVTNLTNAGMFNPLVLPIINVNTFMENQ